MFSLVMIYSQARSVRDNRFTAAGYDGSKPIVTYKPKQREVAPGPPDVPVKHSSSYILKDRQTSNSQAESSRATAKAKPRAGDSADLSGNAFEWALKQADAYFDKVETETATNRQAQLIVKNPGTQVTMKAMQVRGSSLPLHIACPLRLMSFWWLLCTAV
jgi:hypothetical protein